MRTLPAILLALLLTVAFAHSAHAAAVNLQTCTVTPTSGGVAGCPSVDVTYAPVSATTLVRSQVNNIQGWRAFSTLLPNDQVYAADGSWHVLGGLTVARSAPAPPVTTPPAQNPPTVVSVPPQVWTCTTTVTLVTCTSPLIAGALP